RAVRRAGGIPREGERERRQGGARQRDGDAEGVLEGLLGAAGDCRLDRHAGAARAPAHREGSRERAEREPRRIALFLRLSGHVTSPSSPRGWKCREAVTATHSIRPGDHAMKAKLDASAKITTIDEYLATL